MQEESEPKLRNPEMEGSRKPTTEPPSTALAYQDPHYWNERFSKEEHYEWFKDYSHFRHLIQAHIPPTSSVLELGCGNSQLCEEMYRDGITEVTCTDLSAVAVEKMQKRLEAKGYKEIKVLEADMLDLPFNDECFDVVIEKGTMDVLFVNSGDPWNPRSETVAQVKAMLEGVHRVLKPDGIFISISFGQVGPTNTELPFSFWVLGTHWWVLYAPLSLLEIHLMQPHFRRPLFDAPDFTWSVEWSTFGDGFHYFFYVLRKGKRSSSDEGSSGKNEIPSICLFQEELEGEDFIFRTNLDENS